MCCMWIFVYNDVPRIHIWVVLEKFECNNLIKTLRIIALCLMSLFTLCVVYISEGCWNNRAYQSLLWKVNVLLKYSALPYVGSHVHLDYDYVLSLLYMLNWHLLMQVNKLWRLLFFKTSEIKLSFISFIYIFIYLVKSTPIFLTCNNFLYCF